MNEDALFDELLKMNPDVIQDEIDIMTDSDGRIYKIEIIMSF